jgi:hypothetical protein
MHTIAHESLLLESQVEIQIQSENSCIHSLKVFFLLFFKRDTH